MNENEQQQKEEVEALVAIYDCNWHKESDGDNSYSITLNLDVKLYICLHSDYPSNKPPKYQLLAPTLTRNQKDQVHNAFEEIYRDNCGGPILFQWIEKLKEIVSSEEISVSDSSELVTQTIDLKTEDRSQPTHSYEIVHGSIIQDRKSTFQGHSCSVQNHDQVKEVMEILLQNKKIAQATHNILAYRIVSNPATGSILQDFDDDGENHAGGRVLHLLQILNIVNVMVVVTRWYGGIQLGPDRFRHINNAARQVLDQSGFIKNHN